MACRQLYMIAATLLILPSCRARVLTVEWTDEGVAMYSCSGLHVELGDIAIFQCTDGSFSNIIYQPDRAQFDACNTNASAGEAIPFAECRGSVRNITLTVDTRSGDLNSAIPISASESLYFTSYSTGTSQSATTDRTHGGECLMGLKLAMHIAGGNSPASSGTLDADGNCVEDVEGVQPGGSSSNTAIIPIIAGASVGGIVLIGVPLITLCVCTRKSKKKREHFIGVSNGCENGTVVTVKTATLQMNGSGGAPDATPTEVAVSVVVEGNGEKPGPPPLPLPTPAKPQQKIAASNGSAPQPDNSSPRTGGKKNDPSGVQAAGGHRAKPRPNRVAPSNPRGGLKSTAATGAPSSKNASAQPGSVSQRDRAPGSKVSSGTAAKPSPPPAFVQSGVLKSAINANKKADNTDRVTRSLTSNSAPVNDKTDTPVTASLGPQDNPQGRGKATRNVSNPVPSHETVTVASSRDPPKASTTTVTAASSKDPPKPSTTTVTAASSKNSPKPPKPSTTAVTAASAKDSPKPSTTTVTAASSRGPPKPSTTAVTAASSKGPPKPPKPSTAQGSKQKQEAAAVTDREPSSAERRHTDYPEPAQRRPAPLPPPGAQQRLPPLQRCFTDAGQQSREQQAPLTAKLIASK